MQSVNQTLLTIITVHSTCNILQHWHCNTLQHTAPQEKTIIFWRNDHHDLLFSTVAQEEGTTQVLGNKNVWLFLSMSNRCVCKTHLSYLKRAHRQWPQRLSRPSQALQCVAVSYSVHLVRCSVLPTGHLTAVGLFTQMSQIISGGFVERCLERFGISGALSNPV